MIENQSRRTREGVLFFVAFTACVPAANWLIQNVGTVCVPNGPCLIPVGPGLTAPSGVLLVGVALVLRDLVQRRLGLGWAALAILLGGVLSAFFAPPALVVASVAAFLLSELADLAGVHADAEEGPGACGLCQQLGRPCDRQRGVSLARLRQPRLSAGAGCGQGDDGSSRHSRAGLAQEPRCAPRPVARVTQRCNVNTSFTFRRKVAR